MTSLTSFSLLLLDQANGSAPASRIFRNRYTSGKDHNVDYTAIDTPLPRYSREREGKARSTLHHRCRSIGLVSVPQRGPDLDKRHQASSCLLKFKPCQSAALNELDIDPVSLALITPLLSQEMDISVNHKSIALRGAVVELKAPSARNDTANHHSSQGNNTLEQVNILKSNIHASRDCEIDGNMHRAAAPTANAPISDIFAVKQIEEVHSLGRDLLTRKKLLPQRPPKPDLHLPDMRPSLSFQARTTIRSPTDSARWWSPTGDPDRMNETEDRNATEIDTRSRALAGLDDAVEQGQHLPESNRNLSPQQLSVSSPGLRTLAEIHGHPLCAHDSTVRRAYEFQQALLHDYDADGKADPYERNNCPDCQQRSSGLYCSLSSE